MVATLNQPSAISYPFAENGDKNTIPVTNDGTTGAASQSLGFPSITSTAISSGGVPPSRKDFNGIFNLVTGQYFYLQNGGKFTFDQDVSDAIGGYPEGAILSYTDQDNHVYQVVSLVGNNTYNFVTTPSYIDDVHWTKAYNDDLSNYMTLTGSNTNSATNTFSGINTFSGTVNAPTQMSSDDSTKVATTAYVKSQGYAKNSDVVKLTGNQNIAGVKTFTSELTLQRASVQLILKSTSYTKGTAPTSDIYICHRKYLDNDGNDVFHEYYYIPRTTNRPTYILRFQDVSSASASSSSYKDIITADYDGINAKYAINATTATAPTPATSDNSTKIATTAFVSSKLSPNVSSRVTITSSIGTSNGYTAPSNGFITAESTTGEATVKLIIGEYIVAQAYNYHGDSHGNQQTFLCCPIGRGQTVRYTRNSTAVDPALAYFIPYA